MNTQKPELDDRISFRSIKSAAYIVGLLDKMDNPSEVLKIVNFMWDNDNEEVKEKVPSRFSKPGSKGIVRKVKVLPYVKKSGAKVEAHRRKIPIGVAIGKPRYVKKRVVRYKITYTASPSFMKRLIDGGFVIRKKTIQLTKAQRSHLAKNLMASAETKNLRGAVEIAMKMNKMGMTISSAGVRNYLRGESPGIAAKTLENFSEFTGIGPKELLQPHA